LKTKIELEEQSSEIEVDLHLTSAILMFAVIKADGLSHPLEVQVLMIMV